jgi:hypothetical protein
MDHSTPNPPPRIRRRPVPQLRPAASSGNAEKSNPNERLVADEQNGFRRKRQPNSGSFRKGQPSANPRGRPKGARGKKAIVRKVLLEPVTVRLPSGPKRMSVFEALVLKERDLAFNGDPRARKTMLELARWALPEDLLEDTGVVPATDSDVDRAILEWFEDEVRQKEHGKGGSAE